MKAAPVIIVASAGVIACAVAFLLREKSIEAQAQGSLATTLTREDAMRKEMGQLERHKAALEAGRTTAATKGPTQANPQPRNGPARPTSAAMLARQRQATHAALDGNFHALFAKRGLSPEQIDKVLQSIQDHNERKDDITAAAADQKLELTEPGVDAMRKEEMAKFKAEVSPFIGDDGIEQYFKAEHLLPAAELVGQVSGNPYISDGAITQAQGEQLTQIIGAASPSFQNGGTVHYDDVDWKAVQTQAQALLSPAQFNAFQIAISDILVRRQLTQMTRALNAQINEPQAK
jgi:hypothetical protein